MRRPAFDPASERPPVGGAQVVKITCTACGRKLASATYTAAKLVELHAPSCPRRTPTGKAGAGGRGD